MELRELVDMASTSGVVDEDERQMIHSVFELGDTLVREVMVPRPDVVWTERDTPVDKVLRLALKSGYSRIPVLGEDIDDIVGVAYLKDLVRAREEAADGAVGRAVRGDAARGVRARTASGSTSCSRRCRRARNHMAIVIDEYGGTAGVVTIEDVLEEIVGEITDEYDQQEVPDVQVLDGRRLRLSARLPVTDLLELFPGDDGPDERAGRRCWPRPTWTPSVGCSPSSSAGCRCPGREAEVAGLAMLAEGGNDARGRVRITTVLVEPVDPEARQRVNGGDRNGVEFRAPITPGPGS